jgi:hypothetical protein
MSPEESPHGDIDTCREIDSKRRQKEGFGIIFLFLFRDLAPALAPRSAIEDLQNLWTD